MIEYFGPNVARLRKLRGMTQAELAKELGMNCQNLSKMERGLYIPSFAVLEKIQKWFAVSPLELFGSPEERLDRYSPEWKHLIQDALRVVEYLEKIENNREARQEFAALMNLVKELPDCDDKEKDAPVAEENGMDHSFCSNLIRFRKERGLSQSELGELIGLTKQSVINYEKGRAFPTRRRLEKLVEVLNVTPGQLMGGSLE